METWFISDTHFGHKNILEYEKEARPFNTLEEMHNEIVNRWNMVVGKKDIIYHIGDVAFSRLSLHIVSSLNGSKRLVLGNHDTYPSDVYLQYFSKLYGVLLWERCIVSHVPVHAGTIGRRWLLNIHGHLYSKNVCYPILALDNNGNLLHHKDERYFNVSCEQNNLTPINADVIRERIKELK